MLSNSIHGLYKKASTFYGKAVTLILQTNGVIKMKFKELKKLLAVALVVDLASAVPTNPSVSAGAVCTASSMCMLPPGETYSYFWNPSYNQLTCSVWSLLSDEIYQDELGVLTIGYNPKNGTAANSVFMFNSSQPATLFFDNNNMTKPQSMAASAFITNLNSVDPEYRANIGINCALTTTPH